MPIRPGQLRRLKGTSRILEAHDILCQLGVPPAQQTLVASLALLALSGIDAQAPWSSAAEKRLGISEMMELFYRHFRKRYKPNSREQVRRKAIHQFVQMGLALENPGVPDRAVNSQDYSYQLTAELLSCVRTYGTVGWAKALAAYLEKSGAGIRVLFPRPRRADSIPVELLGGRKINLTLGGQNLLIGEIVAKFCKNFAADGVIAYVGDAGAKADASFLEYLAGIGLRLDPHGKFPDVIVHLPKMKWLLLIEAVTTHGPIDIKRHNELRRVFGGTDLGLVFVTAFQTRAAFRKYIRDIAWETEVWIAEEPEHIIHFDGKRFLGPY